MEDKVIVYSIKGQGQGTILWDETSLRMHQHGQIIIPALIENFGRVIVAAADVAQKNLEKLVNSGQLPGWEEIGHSLYDIPWDEVEQVLHTADCSFTTIQRDIEVDFFSMNIPIFRLEDMPGAVFRSDLIHPDQQLGLLLGPGDKYLLFNEASRQIALSKGVDDSQIVIVGMPDFQFPDQADVDEYRQLKPKWKETLGFGDNFVVVYSTSGSFGADLEGLKMAIKAINGLNNTILIICPHPKFYRDYPQPYTDQALKMFSQRDYYYGFFAALGIYPFKGKWDGSKIAFWQDGGKALSQLGLGNAADKFPADLLPADLTLWGIQNSGLINSLHGTQALHICPEPMQVFCLKQTGSKFPMAVDAGILPKLDNYSDVQMAISEADEIFWKFIFNEDYIRKVIPYAGQECIDRIMEVLKS